ncbi:MAG: S26 family signal peptidase [Candidatus Methanomethylophilaceae archaeon]|nr:S26 family signal peptidase [Candidatus Methanomethylophilaceae archaeon]
MEKETKQMLIVCGSIIAVFMVLLGSVYIYSGVNPPFSTINSGSMQHSPDESSIGTIDTGDMVIVKDPDSYDITTYVEGSKTGYKKFGEYGDVIIYKTQTNNIIHRAMLELTLNDIEYEGPQIKKQIWHIPSLIGYDDWDIIEISVGGITSHKNDPDLWDETTGTLTVTETNKDVVNLALTDVGYSDATAFVNLWDLGKQKEDGYSGYLTKGDNAETNTNFDQVILTKMRNKLVSDEDIKSIAVFEIPWLGCIKLLVNGTNTDQIPTNSVIDLVITFVVIIVIAFGLNFILTRRKQE